MSFENAAQKRADEIKARRLGLVVSQVCGFFHDGWVCTSIAHPQAPEQHYFVKERDL